MNWTIFLSASQPFLSIQCSWFTDLGFSSPSSLCTAPPFLFSTVRIASNVNVCNSPGWGVWCWCPLLCMMAGLRSSIWSVSSTESTKSIWTDFWNISPKRDKLGWNIGETTERRQERKSGFGTSLISAWFYQCSWVWIPCDFVLPKVKRLPSVIVSELLTDMGQL